MGSNRGPVLPRTIYNYSANGTARPYRLLTRNVVLQFRFSCFYANCLFLSLVADIVHPVQLINVSVLFIFQQDKGFDRTLFERQMSVMRGQILNLCQALNQDQTPEYLVNMPPVMIEKGSEQTLGGRIRHMTDHFTQRFHDRKPFFSWC